MLYWIGKVLSRSVCRFFGRWKVLGRENIPAKGGVLLCPNHTSYIDPPAAASGCPRRVRFMAKSELFKIPVLGFLIRKVGQFPVKRGTPDRGALKMAVDFLQNGEIVGIFPEGQRSYEGKLLPPEAGVGLIALRAKAPVIPVALINTNKLLPPHSFFFKFSRVKIVYGKPVPLEDLYDQGGREAIEEVGRRTMAAIAKLMEEHA